MTNNKNIFCASNPSKLVDALWMILSSGDATDFSNDIVFLPSRRAVRNVEQMLVKKSRTGAILLPRLVALGEGPDENIDDDEIKQDDVVSNMERTIILAKLLTAQMGGGLSATLPIARDFVRMMDYMENERPEDGSLNFDINWALLVGDEYAAHFQDKAKFLDLAIRTLPLLFPNLYTVSQKRNHDLRAWKKHLSNNQYARIIVCGSTASVPATSDLMTFIANLANGYIILPGMPQKINDITSDICNPYYSVNKFLARISVDVKDIQIIDTGQSGIGFLNYAFSNDTTNPNLSFPTHDSFTRVDCAREAEEAEVIAEITNNAICQNKSVLIVTPDIAANMRIKESLKKRGIDFDTSGGISGAETPLGRFILESIKKQAESKKDQENAGIFKAYKNNNNLLETFTNLVQDAYDGGLIYFDINDEISVAVWDVIDAVSDIVLRNSLDLTLSDIGAVIADALSGASIRPPIKEEAKVSILGTIESRMQSSDIVILTGLNEGMFPAMGYENPWLPRKVSDAIGLPAPERKVSLMALDFMVLSCNGTVYWTRSKMSGSGETTESRFLSRISVAAAKMQNGDGIKMQNGDPWLCAARMRDDVPLNPIDLSAPRPPAIYDAVYVTELELLIHNPFAFYCRHILRLYPQNDPWEAIGAKEFGTMVHGVIEELDGQEISKESIIALFDARARTVLEEGSILFHFWHKRFCDMAPIVLQMLQESNAPDVLWRGTETPGSCEIAGRDVRAKADKVWVKGFTGIVLDVKTGSAPNKKQLKEGMMPQLPLEAFMLQSAGFGYAGMISKTVIQFLQLKNRDVRLIEYQDEDVREMIENSIQKVSELFGRYSRDYEPYEYYETSDEKYKIYDDFARKE